MAEARGAAVPLQLDRWSSMSISITGKLHHRQGTVLNRQWCSLCSARLAGDRFRCPHFEHDTVWTRSSFAGSAAEALVDALLGWR